MNVRWLTACVLAGVLAGCATEESRYERYARVANEAAAGGRTPQTAPAAREAASKEERQRLAEAEKAREAAERKAREAEKALEAARKAQAKAEAKARAQAEAAQERERKLAAEAEKARAADIEMAAQAKERARIATEEVRMAREELARQEREAAKAAAAAPAPAPVALVAPERGGGPSPYATVSSSGVILKPQDVVTVVLRGIPTPEQIEDQIDEEGNISLPLLGEVRAAGYNATDLEREIRRRYVEGKIYQNIAVTVIVPSRFYFMQGEVRSPGRYQLVQAIRLSQAIAQAGGYTEFAGKGAVITRDGKMFKKVGNTRKLATHPEDDILLEPGDIVEIKRSFW